MAGLLWISRLLIFSGLSVSSWGTVPGIEVSGYVKELWHYSRSITDNRPFFLNKARARLSLDATASPLRARIDYDHQLDGGSYFRTADYAAAGLRDPPTWLNLDRTVSRSRTALWKHRFYRAWLGFEGSQTAVRFGRQAIAWGTGKLWNPTDVLNPFQPTSLERDERRGVDSLYIRRDWASLSQGEVVYAPFDQIPETAVLGRVRTHWGNYDICGMGGKVPGSTTSWMLGGDFAGNLWEGTFRGEWSYTEQKIRPSYWRIDIGYDYTMPAETRVPGLKDAALAIEYFHNGTLAQDYAGFTFSKDIHPLVKLDLTLIANLNDSSRFLGPCLQWNVLRDLYLTAGLQHFDGRSDSEFGRAARVIFFQGQYFF